MSKTFASIAVGSILAKKLGFLGRGIGICYERLEKRLLRSSDAVVFITEDFEAVARGWGIAAERCHVIENWAPLDEFPTGQYTLAFVLFGRHGLFIP